MIEAQWENHRSHGYIWIVILKLCPLLTCSKFSTCKDAVFTERPTEHEATVWAPTNGGRHDLSAGSIMNPLTNQLCFPLSTVINLGCWVFSHYSWDMSPLSLFNMFLPRRNVQRLPGRMLPHRESSTPADGKMINHQGHHGMWKMLTQYATVFKSGETWWPGIQHRWKIAIFPPEKPYSKISKLETQFSPWYPSTSNLHLQGRRLRRQVSTTGARQAMMGKQPDRKASFSCHNLISDIFQSQSTINWMGEHGILKHFAYLSWGPQPPLHRWRCHCRRVLRCQHIREHNTSLSRTHPDAQYWTCHEIYIDIPSYQARKSQLNLGAFNHCPFCWS